MPSATAINHRWRTDFIHDQLEDGRYFCILHSIDDFTLEAVAVEVDTSFSGKRVVCVLDDKTARRGLPKVIVCDDGTEFTRRALQVCSTRYDSRHSVSDAGKPTQNVSVDPFSGRMRDKVLSQYFSLGSMMSDAVPHNCDHSTKNVDIAL